MTHRSFNLACAGPQFLLGMLVILSLLAADVLSLGDSSVGQLMLLISMPFWMTAALARKTLLDRGSRLFATYILFCAGILLLLSLLSATHSDTPLRAARVSISMISAFSMYFFVIGTVTDGRAFVAAQVLTVGAAVISVVSIVGYLDPRIGAWVFGNTDRSSGTFKNPNQFGIVISMISPLAISFLLIERGLKRLLAAALLVLIFIGLALSGSKTNLVITALSLVLILVVVAFVSHQGPKKGMAILLATVTSLVLSSVGVLALRELNPRAFELLSGFFSGDLDVPTIVARRELWAYSLGVFFDRPFLGEGAGKRIDFFLNGRVLTYSHSHNTVLDYARTLGALGAVMIMSIYVLGTLASLSTALDMRRAPGMERRSLLAFAAGIGSMNYLAANLMSESFGPTTIPFFWLLLFLMLHLKSARSDSVLYERAIASRTSNGIQA